MNILGICDSQDSGAVLCLGDLRQITAVNEERLSRRKLDGSFPWKSIAEVLHIKNLQLKDIQLIAFASIMTPSCVLRNLRNFHRYLRGNNGQFSFFLALYTLYQVAARKIKLIEWGEKLFSKLYILKKLRKKGFKGKVEIIEHHQAHAYAAYATSGFKKALVITIDGLGDGMSFTVNTGGQGKVQRIFQQNAFNDITLYYSRLTELLGFTPIKDEGKVMGLAAYSQSDECLEYAQKLLRVKNGRFFKRNLFFKSKRIYSQLRNRPREVVATAFQTHLETSLAQIVSYWVKKTGIENVALGGGLFANIKVNQKLSKLAEVKSLYVFPHPGDGGLAFGAVAAVLKQPSFCFRNVFLGREYSSDKICEMLDCSNTNYQYEKDIGKKVAYLLSQGKIVMRFAGRMEYGPRALGNRSILSQATDPKIVIRINEVLARDIFMPFGPVILNEDKDFCCQGTRKASYSAKFMNISFNATREFKELCPAVIHLDGTTRPQFVLKEDNPQLYEILEEYKNITGIPALINTSFNLHEEPIVCNPEDALKTFLKTKFDYLTIGNFMVRRD